MSDPQHPVTEPTAVVPDAEPDGVVEVQGKRMVPVDALVAERERARTTTEQRIRAEYEPMKARAAQADQLEADIQALKPHIDYLQKHPEVIQRPAGADDIPDVSNDDAEKFARRYELYTPTGLDVARAKQMIADNRAETRRIAVEAAQEAVQPYARTTREQLARQNFLWAANQKGADGQPLIDATVLFNEWQKIPTEITANPELTQVILDVFVGKTVRSGHRAPAAPDREPIFSEPSGGPAKHPYRMSPFEKAVAKVAGLSEKAFSEQAHRYQPDSINSLED